MSRETEEELHLVITLKSLSVTKFNDERLTFNSCCMVRRKVCLVSATVPKRRKRNIGNVLAGCRGSTCVYTVTLFIPEFFARVTLVNVNG